MKTCPPNTQSLLASDLAPTRCVNRPVKYMPANNPAYAKGTRSASRKRVTPIPWRFLNRSRVKKEYEVPTHIQPVRFPVGTPNQPSLSRSLRLPSQGTVQCQKPSRMATASMARSSITTSRPSMSGRQIGFTGNLLLIAIAPWIISAHPNGIQIGTSPIRNKYTSG